MNSNKRNIIEIEKNNAQTVYWIFFFLSSLYDKKDTISKKKEKKKKDKYRKFVCFLCLTYDIFFGFLIIRFFIFYD